MDEEKKDVKKEEATTTPVSEEKEQSEEVSEDVKTPEDVVDKSVYEKVREAMKAEREAKKAEKARVAELEEKIAKFEKNQEEQSQTFEEDSPYDPYKAKTDILFMMNKDPFVKDNLDLIEEKMTSEKLDIQSAVRELKAEYFDRISKEDASKEDNKLLKQAKPTATEEEVTPEKPKDSSKLFKDALSGKVEIDPAQLEAIKHYLPRQQ